MSFTTKDTKSTKAERKIMKTMMMLVVVLLVVGCAKEAPVQVATFDLAWLKDKKSGAEARLKAYYYEEKKFPETYEGENFLGDVSAIISCMTTNGWRVATASADVIVFERRGANRFEIRKKDEPLFTEKQKKLFRESEEILGRVNQ